MTGLICSEDAHIRHFSSKVRELYSGFGRAPKILLSRYAGLYLLGLCLNLAVFLQRSTVIVSHFNEIIYLFYDIVQAFHKHGANIRDQELK